MLCQAKQTSKIFGWFLVGFSGIGLAITAVFAQSPESQPKRDFFSSAQIQFYEVQVEPILKKSCFSCHGEGAELSGGLNLTNRSALLKGGISGSAISLAKPADSLLLHAINYQGRQMPPSGKLPQSQIDILTKWVGMGCPLLAQKNNSTGAPVKKGPPPVNEENKRFWSFQPVHRPAPPEMKGSSWVKNPIDAFVLAKLKKSGLKPSPLSERTALLRRVTYDLTGLPPALKEVQAFLGDKRPNAYEKVVDRLLASRQYGERWGRHWLDLVRYAETNSFERDGPKPFVWRYRDYIIRSFNEDKPYDQFIREQLAGDELPARSVDSLIATGYYRLGTWDDEPSDPLQARYDEFDDIAATTGQVFLGLTVNCARCHDHKLDPIPQKDYYRFLSFFQGLNRFGNGGGDSVDASSLRTIASPAEQSKHAAEEAAYKQKLDTLESSLKKIEDMVRNGFQPVEKEEFTHEDRRIAILKKRVPGELSDESFKQYVDLFKQRDQLRKAPPIGLEMALCATEGSKIPPPTYVLLRGSPHAQGDQVEPAFLSILSPPAPVIPALAPEVQSSGRRLALANWIANKDNQLTARVMVNRVWQHHFGRGIVRSTSNFGFQGTPPTHPELLDWLASEFMRKGWKLKSLHKLILMSNTYQMSSAGNAAALKKDPENDLFWRFDMRRLDAEEIRDSVLAVNGSLNMKMGGPSIFPVIPKEVLAGQSMPGSGWNVSIPDDQRRRSVYVHIKRSMALPILASFDAADTDFTCPARFSTTQPTQALGMLNSVFMNDQARIFADYLKLHAGSSKAAQVKLGLGRVLQREPSAKEIQRGIKFMNQIESRDGISSEKVLNYFCVVALSLNEFIYLD